MPRIFITSGTLFTLPADFNPANNTVECYGAGVAGNADGVSGYGGGGGAYSSVSNIKIASGVQVTIQVGSAGQTDTFFNATSLSNAVANGTTISCGAQGASGGTGTAGLAASGCGTVKNSGGAGGSTSGLGGGGGGGCGGSTGPGAAGGNGNGGGGGGGAANNGGAGGNGFGGGSTPSGGGTGGAAGTFPGGTGGTYPFGTCNGGAGSGGSGGGGGACNGGAGSLNNVYLDGAHGPGSGGGGGGGYSNGVYWNGGNAGGYGAGGGSEGGLGVTSGTQTDGLIVITYVPVPLIAVGIPGPILQQKTPAVFTAPVSKPKLDALTPTQTMGWYQQPADLLAAPGKASPTFWNLGAIPQVFPNPTPLIWPPHLYHAGLQKLVPVLDFRQQFPGLAPSDFHLTVSEGLDKLASFTQLSAFISAAINEYDTVSAGIVPIPVTGSAVDIVARVKLLLPKGWWAYKAPIRDAILGGIADGASWCYSLATYSKLQSRVAWATGVWLDIVSHDYFGLNLPRKTNESDPNFRLRIQKELIRERVTRKGMTNALKDLLGAPPSIFEPWNTGDAGAWDNGTFALDAAGGWGDTILPAQSFVNVTPPGAGIVGAPGWDTASLGWDIGGEWGDMSQISGTITNQDIYDTINKTRPTGSIVWTQLFPVQAPVPPPIPPSLTLPMLIPGWTQPSVWRPIFQAATMPLTQIEGSFAVNPVNPGAGATGMTEPWLTSQPPIHRPTIAIAEMPTGYGGFQAVNPVTPSFAPPCMMNEAPIHRPAKLQDWTPVDFYGGTLALNESNALLPWLSTSPVVQPNPSAYSVSMLPQNV